MITMRNVWIITMILIIMSPVVFAQNRTYLFDNTNEYIIEDAYLDEDNARTGTETVVVADLLDGTGEVPFFKFDITHLPDSSTILFSELKLFSSVSQTANLDVWYVDNQTWDETEVDNWCAGVWCDNATNKLNKSIATGSGTGTSNTWTNFSDVTYAVEMELNNSNNYVSFALNNTGLAAEYYNFISLDSPYEWRGPRLEVTVDLTGQDNTNTTQIATLNSATLDLNTTSTDMDHVLIWKQYLQGAWDEFGSVIVKDDILYGSSKEGYSTSPNNVYAINTSNKKMIWQARVGSSDGTPIVDNDYLYINMYGDEPGLYKINKSNGDIIENNVFCLSAQSAIMIDDIIVDGCHYAPQYYAVNKTTMKTLWSFEKPDTSSDRAPITPASSGDGVIIGFFNNADSVNVFKLNISTGEQIWNQTVFDGFWDIKPLIKDDVVYLGTDTITDIFGALNYTTGEFIWNSTSYGDVLTNIGYRDGYLFFGGQNSKMYKVDASDGSLSCQYNTSGHIYQGPSLTAFSIGVFGSNDDFLYMINVDDCSLIWKYETGANVMNAPAISKGKMYFKSDDHYLYAFDLGHGTEEWSTYSYNNSGGSYCQDCLTEYKQIESTCSEPSYVECTIENEYNYSVNTTMNYYTSKIWYNKSNYVQLTGLNTSYTMQFTNGNTTILLLDADSNPPTFDHTISNFSISYNSEFSYDINATDAEGQFKEYSINDTNLFEINSTTGVLTNKTLSEGEHYLQINISDIQGNTNSGYMLINITDFAPTFDHDLANFTISYNGDLSYDINATDTENAISSYAVNDSDFSINANGLLTEGAISERVYYLKINVTDENGKYAEDTMTVNVTDFPPEFDHSIPNFTISYTESFSYDINASDPEGGSVTYSINNTNNFTLSPTGLLTNKTLESITYYLRVTIEDENTNTDYTDFWINITDLAPTFDHTLTNFTIGQGESLNYDINATDTEGQFDTFAVNDSDFSITDAGILTNLSMSFITYYLEIAINDTNNNINYGYMTVEYGDFLAPTFDETVPDFTLNISAPFYWDFNATDAEGNFDKFSISGSALFTINPTTGIMENNSALSITTYSMTIFINDTFGNTNNETFTIQVYNSSDVTIEQEESIFIYYTQLAGGVNFLGLGIFLPILALLTAISLLVSTGRTHIFLLMMLIMNGIVGMALFNTAGLITTGIYFIATAIVIAIVIFLPDNAILSRFARHK